MRLFSLASTSRSYVSRSLSASMRAHMPRIIALINWRQPRPRRQSAASSAAGFLLALERAANRFFSSICLASVSLFDLSRIRVCFFWPCSWWWQ